MSDLVCSICKKTVDEEQSAILTMSNWGNPRHMCDECQSLFNTALKSHDAEEIEKAASKLGELMERADVDDMLVIDAVGGLLEEARERKTQIENGEYDFSLDEEQEEEIPEEFANYEEPVETETERAEREEKERLDRILNLVSTIVFGAIIAGFLVYMTLKLLGII